MNASSPGSELAARPAETSHSRVAVVTLGCARNEVDSEELAARLEAGGFELTDDAAEADSVIVNTCGFVEAAKQDSIDALLEAAEPSAGKRPTVVAVGCLAERYGAELAEALPEADAVLGFDDYTNIAARVRQVLRGEPHGAHQPRDRRRLLPLAPAERHPAAKVDVGSGVSTGGTTGWGPRTIRRRLVDSPVAPLKLASGCDRRCAFCAIPTFRGAFVSRDARDIVAEAEWLAGQGVRELFLVSENSTSYGKDLGDLRALESLLPRLAALPDVRRVRVSYLQPAEMRPSLIEAITATSGVADYFDLSFQHVSSSVLRRMRRFGDGERFLGLLADVRVRTPDAGVRSNVIVGFPGETEDDVQQLCHFLEAAELDAVGVFGYSDEDGTEAATLPGKLDAQEIEARREYVVRLAEELTAQRAESRCGETVEVLLEAVTGTVAEGRSAAQGPDVDGSTTVSGLTGGEAVGELVTAFVTGSAGVDLHAAAQGHAQ